ncbi:MAG: tetratricopeptide repeat protein [Bacteroidota bacterium]
MSACKNTKSGFVSRNYHDLTARYNGLYNANLKIAEGAQTLSNAQPDIYDRTLPVFKYADAQKAKSIYPQMDEALKKTSTVIQRHTLVDKNGNEKPDKEHWIDDNWIAYGKALFYKHEYFAAIETFKYVETTYKKEQGRHEASLWLAKTYLQLTQLKEAEDKLDYLRNQKDLSKKVRAEYDAVAADYYLQTRNTDRAIEHLKKAIPVTKNRNNKIRYMFILAQLYQVKGDFKSAFELYTKVIKKNPVYEMAFNARINRARCFDAQSQNSNSVKKELQKMARDPKNKEYLDQVYYALAGIAQKENKEGDEIVYLQKSIAASTSNQNQKAISYLELGKIYLSKPDYRTAQLYYDSCISSLGNDHPDYTDILTKRNSLTKLIKALNTIHDQDSMMVLAKMSPAEREKAVDEMLKKEDEERQRKIDEEKEQQVNQLFNTDNKQQQQANHGGESSWYFYNQSAISFGTNDFQRKWGSRKLEDNWRRNNKQLNLQEEEVVVEDSVKDEIKDPTEAREAHRKELLEKIPSDQASIDKSTGKVIDAYYNAAMIYNEQLNDKPASAKMFEDLLAKYPDNKYKLPAYYQLYRLYLAMKDPQKSDYYKNILLEKYPDSDYAMIIKNPNFMAEKAAKKSDLELFYEDTYRKYLNGEYADVITRKAQADQMYPNNVYVPKFDMLKTLAIGRTQPVGSFTASLQDIVRNYSEDPVKEQAQDILDYINGMGAVSETKMPEKDTLERMYNYSEDTTHLLVLAFRNVGPLNSDQLKIKLSNYNTKYYSTKGYSITSQLLDHITQIIIIREFTNKNEAMLYFTGANDNDEIFGNTNPDLYQMFVMSDNNFPSFVKDKKIETYQDFFRKFYQ